MAELPTTGNRIIDLSFAFALKIVAYTEKLEELRKYVISNQLLKNGTSVGANVREAQNCESKADFIHKFKIAAKEADETEYWLLLCKYSDNYPFEESLMDDIKEIQRIVNSIISSSKSK
ncbi:MAG: four helix bundle protein [Paludibacter sp.]